MAAFDSTCTRPEPTFPDPLDGFYDTHVVFHRHSVESLVFATDGLGAIVELIEGDEVAEAMNGLVRPANAIPAPRLSAPQRSGLLSAAKALVDSLRGVLDDHQSGSAGDLSARRDFQLTSSRAAWGSEQ